MTKLFFFMKGRFILFVVLGIFVEERALAQSWKRNIDTANMYKAQRNMSEAIRYYQKAKAELQKDSLYTNTYIQTAKNIGDLYYVPIGEGDKAILVYEELRVIISKMNQTRTRVYSDICNNLGTIYNLYGLLDTALFIHSEARVIRKELFGDTSAAYAQSCNNLGALYRDFGFYDLAEPLLLKAKEIREKIQPAKRVPVYAITCVALGNLYRDMGKYEEAVELYIIAKNVREDTLGRKHPQYANSCNILADIYSYMQQFDKAETLYLEAKELRSEPGNEEAYAETCNNLGALYREKGQFVKAEPLLMEAKKIYESKFPEGHPNCPINYNNLGELYYAMGNYKEAESFYLKSRKIWENKLGVEHPFYISNSDEMIRLYRNTYEVAKADQLIQETSRLKFRQLNKVFQFTSEAEKNQYLKNINGAGDEYLSFYFKYFPHSNAGQPYDISISNRNLILGSIQQTRQAIYSSADPILSGIYSEWTNTRQQLAKLFSRGAQADTLKLKLLQAKADKMEKELSRGSAAFKTLQTIPGWRDIQQNLRADETAIEFAEFRIHNNWVWTDSILYAAILIKKNLSEPIFIPLLEKKQLEQLLNTRNAGSLQGINLRYSSPELFKLVWQPLEKYLSGVSKIYFAPAGMLHKVSMAALKMNNNQLVSDKYQLVQLLTTASLTDQTETTISSTDKLFLYGAVQYDADSSSLFQATLKYNKSSLVSRSGADGIIDKDGDRYFTPLTYSGREIDSIAQLAEKKMITPIFFKGAEANEESIKALNEEPSPFVLHISTHGFFNPDPKNSKRYNNIPTANVFQRADNPLFRGGLIMAGAENTWRGNPVSGIEDGILTAFEVSNLFFPNNKLVVLSACETALGDIEGSEGVYGLQRAFKIAGTRNLIMSLWKVPDQETAEFMQAFYKQLFDQQSVTQSFYKAQQAMKNKYRNEPYKWAAWILVR